MSSNSSVAPNSIPTESHDAVLFGIPKSPTLTEDQRNGVAQQIHSALQSAAGSSHAMRPVMPSGERAGSMTSNESDATVDARRNPVMEGVGQALGDVWDVVKGTPAEVVHSLPPVALADSVKQALPQIHAYESARNSGKSVSDSLEAASTYIKAHDALHQAITDRIADFQKSPVQAGVRTAGDVAAFVASLGLGPEASEAEATGAVPKVFAKPPRSLKVIPPAAGDVAPVAPLSEAERAATAFAHKIYGTDEPEVELLGHPEDEPAVNVGGKTERSALAKARTNASVVPDEEAQQLASKVLNEHAKQVAAANDPVAQLDAIKKRLSISSAKLERIGADAVPPTAGDVAAFKTKILNKAQAATAKITSAESGSDALRVNTWEAKNDAGDLLGHLKTTAENGDTARVDQVSSNLPAGSSMGTRLYTTAAKDLAKKGFNTLKSDGVLSDSAVNTWRKLSQIHDNITEIPAAKVGENPTFEWDLSGLKPTLPVAPKTEPEPGFVGRALRYQGVPNDWRAGVTGAKLEKPTVSEYRESVDKAMVRAGVPIDVGEWDPPASKYFTGGRSAEYRGGPKVNQDAINKFTGTKVDPKIMGFLEVLAQSSEELTGKPFSDQQVESYLRNMKASGKLGPKN
jgi:hypothetical protein